MRKLLPLTAAIALTGCVDMLTATADFQTDLPTTNTFEIIPGLPTGDAVLVQSFETGTASDITIDTSDPITGSKSYAIPEVTRFQVFNTPPGGGQTWLPNRRHSAKFRSRPFAKARINGSTSRFTFKYRSRDVGPQATTTEPLVNPVTASVGEGGNFATTMRIMTEVGDGFPTPGSVSGPQDILNANFFDDGGDCGRLNLRVLRGLFGPNAWDGDDRQTYVSFPIGSVMTFQITAVNARVVGEVRGTDLVALGSSNSGWQTACTDPANTTTNVAISGRILDEDAVERTLEDYLFPDSIELAIISVVAEQGVTVSSYISPAGGTVTNDDFELSGDRPYSSVDDINVKVANP